jgi:hypothetical protein
MGLIESVKAAQRITDDTIAELFRIGARMGQLAQNQTF